MPGSQGAHRSLLCSLFQSFLDQFADHCHKTMSRANRCGTGEWNSMLLTGIGSLFIKVEHDFHVIADESNWSNNQAVRRLLFCQVVDDIADIWFKPWLLWWTTSTLEHKLPVADAISFSHQSASFGELFNIITVIGHRHWNTVSGEKCFHFGCWDLQGIE